MSTRLLLAVAAVIVITSLPVHAADEQFCKEYARVAVEQFRDAERFERCDPFRRRDPGRWQGDFRAHYDWCRGVRRDDAWRERDERSRALDHCARDRR